MKKAFNSIQGISNTRIYCENSEICSCHCNSGKQWMITLGYVRKISRIDNKLCGENKKKWEKESSANSEK